MEARELRIGSIVDWNGERAIISQILEFEVAFKCGESDLIESVKPIPITEEMLLKCGFEKSKNRGAEDYYQGKSFAQLKPRASFDYFIGGYEARCKQAVKDKDGDFVDDKVTMNYGTYRVRIGADYKYKRFAVYFDQYVYMQLNGIYFQPLQAEWYAGVKYNVYKKIDLKLEHLCIHPVITDHSYYRQSRMYGGYNMISISYGYNN